MMAGTVLCETVLSRTPTLADTCASLSLNLYYPTTPRRRYVREYVRGYVNWLKLEVVRRPIYFQLYYIIIKI